MAVTATSHFNNGIVGTPQIGADVDIYESHATPKFAIGTGFERSDGAKFRYSHFGVNTLPGVLVSTDFSESNQVRTSVGIVISSSATAVGDEAIKPGTKGSRYVEIIFASITANKYAGGYLVICEDSGAGYTYRVKGNTATNSPVSGNFRLELYQPLQETVTNASDWAIFGSKYANLEAHTQGTDAAIAGVTVSDIKVATAAYGWIQTKGILGVLIDDTSGVATDIGAPVAISEALPGGIMVAGADVGSLTQGSLAAELNNIMRRPIVGRLLMTVPAASAHAVVDLNVD